MADGKTESWCCPRSSSRGMATCPAGPCSVAWPPGERERRGPALSSMEWGRKKPRPRMMTTRGSASSWSPSSTMWTGREGAQEGRLAVHAPQLRKDDVPSVEGFAFTMKKIALGKPELFVPGELALLREETYRLTNRVRSGLADGSPLPPRTCASRSGRS